METKTADDQRQPQASKGYPKLAKMMATSDEATIFRQFRDMQILNLLRLQAELQDIERKYHDVRVEDDKDSDQQLRQLSGDFRFMRDLAEEDGESEQYSLLKEFGKLVKEYSEFPAYRR